MQIISRSDKLGNRKHFWSQAFQMGNTESYWSCGRRIWLGFLSCSCWGVALTLPHVACGPLTLGWFWHCAPRKPGFHSPRYFICVFWEALISRLPVMQHPHPVLLVSLETDKQPSTLLGRSSPLYLRPCLPRCSTLLKSASEDFIFVSLLNSL